MNDRKMEITLDDLQSYARCPLEWFWERRVGVPRPQTIAALAPAAIRAGLGFYYAGHAEELAAGVGFVWQDWCDGWGETALARDLAQYAVGRARILDMFATGHVRRPDGGRYTVPEMTTEYRTRMHSAGLTKLGRKLDEFARTHGLLPADEDDRPGSALGDAFAASLGAAERVASDLPAREVVLGLNVPYQVDLVSGVHILGQADLVMQAETEPGAAVLEIHDFDAVPWMRAGLAGRDLRTIAASLAQPVSIDGDDPTSFTWERVERVVFRHWPTGQAFTFRETNSGYLLALVASIARGMRQHVVVPRAVTGYDGCRPCAYREQCWNSPHWDTLPLVDAGGLGAAEAVAAVIRRLRAALGSDSVAADRTRQALAVLEASLSEIDTPALLAATRLALDGKGNYDR